MSVYKRSRVFTLTTGLLNVTPILQSLEEKKSMALEIKEFKKSDFTSYPRSEAEKCN